MCKDRRATVSVVEMSGDHPVKKVSLTATRVQIWTSIIGGIAAVIVIFSVFMGLSYKYMTRSAEIHFQERVDAAIKDGGKIDRAIDRKIQSQMRSIEMRLVRIETLLLEMRTE